MAASGDSAIVRARTAQPQESHVASEAIAWPRKTRELETRLMDSRRWNGFHFREGDIVVDTWAKSGTTWTQQILAQLIFDGAAHAPGGHKVSPWVDLAVLPVDEMTAQVEAQTHRRFLKSHLPLDALVISDEAKYIYIGRDVRDVAWSLYNHQAGYSDLFIDMLNSRPDHTGPKIGRPTSDVRDFYHYFLETGGVFDAETGAPFGGNIGLSGFWEHAQSFWDSRNAPNLLLVHFNNLKIDLAGEIRRIARFLDIALDEALLPTIVEHCGIDYMRNSVKADTEAHARTKLAFTGGADTFYNEGTNGRWRDVLDAREIAKADDIAAKNLTPDCAHWLKTGEMPA